MIELILTERVAKLGQPGDIVKVRPGYARNKLIPTGQALRATEANRRVFEQRKVELEEHNRQRRIAAEESVVRLQNVKITVLRQAGETGHLFGSVSARDVTEAAAAAGHTVTRESVLIETPIKTLGLHSVTFRPHPDVLSTLTVNVARNAHEAAVQAGEKTAESDEEEGE